MLYEVITQNPEQWFKDAGSSTEISSEAVEKLIAERKQAKLDKNYARADEIRQELSAQGIILEDSRAGTSWRRS